MDWDGIDLREYERIEGQLVPECFRFFIIEQGTGNKIKAETTDFTVKGLRLLIPQPLEDMQTGDGLIIYPKDESYKLVGEVIYIVSVSDEMFYAGIRFLRTGSLNHYTQIVEKIEINDQNTVRI